MLYSMAASVLCLVLLLAVSEASNDVTVRKFSNNDPSQGQNDALRIINANLGKNPMMSQFSSLESQPMLYGLPQPRYFIMPESQDQIDFEKFNPQQISFINNKFIPINPKDMIDTNPMATVQSLQRFGNNKDELSPRNADPQQEANDESEILSPKAIGNAAITPLSRLFSILG